MKALSVRQPWAWAIIAGHKRFENRTWNTTLRGRVMIHAGAAAVTHEELQQLSEHARRQGFALPAEDELWRGGLIGSVDIFDVVTSSRDPWFRGPYGWKLAHPRPSRFTPLAGKLRLFDVDGVRGG
jgi:hypothetical protein